MAHRVRWGRRRDDAAEHEAPEGAAPRPKASARERAPSSEEADDPLRALETLAFALRTWGHFAIELAQQDGKDVAREEFDAWARQVLPSETGPAAETREFAPVDWDGLERFLLGQRKHEQRTVADGVANLREAIWAFVQCFHRSLRADSSYDARASEQLSRLRQAALGSDFAVLKREALSSESLLRGAIDAREARYRQQVEILSAKVARLARDLIRARQDAVTDPLTGLSNRAGIDAELQRLTEMGVLLSAPPLLIFLDIDHFKWVNDRYGHQVGDELLRRVAKRLSAAFRADDDFVGRLGGDEFAIALRGAQPGSDGMLADRALCAVGEVELETESGPVRISGSAGAARLVAGDTTSTWARRADAALYAAKRAGRARSALAPPPGGADPGTPANVPAGSVPDRNAELAG